MTTARKLLVAGLAAATFSGLLLSTTPAAAWGRGWGGGGPLDLSRTVVVVQTKQAGRRLRAAKTTRPSIQATTESRWDAR